MRTILLISPYWREPHRWMVSSVKLAELWQRLGYRVVVVCMGSTTGMEKVSDTLTIYRKKDWFLKDPLNFGIAFGFTHLVRRVIKTEKPDLIVCNKVLFWSSFSVIALRLTGHKILLLTDALVGITWQARRVLPRLLMRIGAWTIGWWVLLSADRIVTFHPQPESILKRLGIFKKTRVIPTGIDPVPFGKTSREAPSSFAKDSDGQAMQATGNRQEARAITVSYIGRLESVKGVDDFLAAAVKVKQEYPALKVQVVGWYPSTSSGQADHPLVKRYEREVTFTGLRDDVADVLAHTDIFVLPSYSEGLSNALMEAMASGCACVATDVGGNRFLVQNGISGFLFPPGDREALAAHLRRLVDDPSKRRALGLAAHDRIKQTFGWDVVGKQYQSLFDAILQ